MNEYYNEILIEKLSNYNKYLTIDFLNIKIIYKYLRTESSSSVKMLLYKSNDSEKSK